MEARGLTTPGIPSVPPTEAQRMVEAGALLVDVREVDEYAQVRIPGASLMPLSALADAYTKLPADREVVLYCRSGARSANAVAALTGQAGMTNVHNLEGGIVEWYEEGLPISTDHVAIPAEYLPFQVTEPDLAHKHIENGELRWVLDVRTPEQFATGHVPGALNIPVNQLPMRYRELPRAERILITCDRGEVSLLAARLLNDLDFADVAVLDGGLEAWRYHELPLGVSG